MKEIPLPTHPVIVHYHAGRKYWSVKGTHPPSDRNPDPTRPWGFERLVGHSSILFMEDCHFSVAQSGHARTVFNETKNVHAGVVGRLVGNDGTFGGERVTYNPFTDLTFINSTGRPVKRARRVVMNCGIGVMAEGLEYFSDEEIMRISKFFAEQLSRLDTSGSSEYSRGNPLDNTEANHGQEG